MGDYIYLSQQHFKKFKSHRSGGNKCCSVTQGWSTNKTCVSEVLTQLAFLPGRLLAALKGPS